MPSPRASARTPRKGRLPDLERFLTYRLHVVNKLSDRDTHRAYLEQLELPLGEARCLAAIGRFEPLSVKDLARAANLDKGQASRSAQCLVERGLVDKTTSHTDARGVWLTLTPPGSAMYERVIRLIQARNREIFGCLSAAEQDQLGSLLDRVGRHMLENAAQED
ncbi:MarR family winged helix-turn-helix transcriptional regulator [Bordetella sp. FB-8]|uniref:MarR family winged helix-turn-helix transcriptional regulator n=1 Tax=Bordetella sp. FB-8 TaxID=1159870 RepID=UPI00037B743A|nr:MarR family transcriptional regulator [Bordetella sp. FB-8]